jgi:hypothetical protein
VYLTMPSMMSHNPPPPQAFGRDVGGKDFREMIGRFAAVPGSQIIAVMGHRRTYDWLVSQWAQTSTFTLETRNGKHSSLSISFEAMLTSNTQEFIARSSFDGYERLATLLGPEHVTVVSVDALRERNSSPLAFLICVAPRHLTGDALARCDREMTLMEQTAKRLRVSAPALHIDVARLARNVHLEACGEPPQVPSDVEGDARRVKGVADAARRMPTTCDDFGKPPREASLLDPTRRSTSLLERIADGFDDNFLRGVGAALPSPRERSADHCFVDQARLAAHHLVMLRTLTPPCGQQLATHHLAMLRNHTPPCGQQRAHAPPKALPHK